MSDIKSIIKKVLDEDITLAQPKKAPFKKLEKDIQREICDWLYGQSFFFWRSNNVPVFDKGKMAYRSLPKYTPRGLPDIMIIVQGHFIGLEVKVPDYWKYTDDQKAIRDKIISNGGSYHLVTSLNEAVLVMDGYNQK